MPIDVPAYENNLPLDEAADLVRDALSALKVPFEVITSAKGISTIALYDVEERRSEVNVPARLFNPEEYGFAFPRYLWKERSSRMKSRLFLYAI